MLVRNDWTILMMGGGSAEVGELTWPLRCGDFFSASLTCWAKCKWCHLPLLEWEAKLSGHGGFTERVVWLTLKWLWGYFFSISSLLEIFARFYCRWGLGGECIMLRETKPQPASCSWIIAILSQLWLKSKTLYRSLNEMLANIFLAHWKCNLPIEHCVPVNFTARAFSIWIREVIAGEQNTGLAPFSPGWEWIPKGVESRPVVHNN